MIGLVRLFVDGNMGREARARGTYEERKAAAIARDAESRRLYYEKLDREADERDLMDRQRRSLLTPAERAAEDIANIKRASFLAMAIGMIGSLRI